MTSRSKLVPVTPMVLFAKAIKGFFVVARLATGVRLNPFVEAFLERHQIPPGKGRAGLPESLTGNALAMSSSAGVESLVRIFCG